MITTKLLKLATQFGMKSSAGVAYGSVMGYATTFSEGNGYKLIAISTGFSDPAQISQLQALVNGQDLKNQYLIQQISFGSRQIRITFRTTRNTEEKMQAFISWFYSLLPQYGATGISVCPVCGQPITDGGWKLLGDTAYYMHEPCALQVRQSLEAQTTQKQEEDTGSYGWGLLGAILGAALGGVLWAVVLGFGYVAALVGLVIGLLAEKGYRLLKGKEGKAKVLILLLAVIFGVVFGTFLTEAYDILKLGFAFQEIPQVLQIALMDSEYTGYLIGRVLLGLLFAGLGVFSLLRKTGQEISGPRMINLT